MARLLVLGGSWFLGTRIVSDAMAAGWEVTTFRRGYSGDDVPGAHTIRGDRTSADDLARLVTAGPWDAVVDTSGYVPANVGTVARALASVAERYLFLSTVSVYQDWPVAPVAEGAELRLCSPTRNSEDGSPGDPGPAFYGGFKAGSERAVIDAFGSERAVQLRPGVMTGPREYIGRLPGGCAGWRAVARCWPLVTRLQRSRRWTCGTCRCSWCGQPAGWRAHSTWPVPRRVSPRSSTSAAWSPAPPRSSSGSPMSSGYPSTSARGWRCRCGTPNRPPGRWTTAVPAPPGTPRARLRT